MFANGALLAQLRDQGARRLACFTSEELVAAGADSPLEGPVASERLASMRPDVLAAALSAALRGLVARGFVASEETPAGPRADRPLQDLLETLAGVRPPKQGPTASLPLTGDLALVAALRRAPALVALVSEPTAADLTRRGPLAHRRTDAILHGFTDGGEHLAGVLEERRSPLGIHAFVLRTLAQATRSLWTSLEARLATAALEQDGTATCETALEVPLPTRPGRPPARLLVRLEASQPGSRLATITWPAQGVPATEQLAASSLPRRLSEALEAIWREGGDGVAKVTAS